ncbi:hypothetical protein, partial [Kiloniella laminariae]|uniref:hypothetical protein n=1 Tax=Kiloniella laminariae TaxID=454162 RepID=UPI0005247B34
MRKLTPGGAAPNPLLLPLACSLACSLALFALPLNAQTVASTTPGVPTPVTSAAPIGASEEVLQEKLFSASAKSLTQLIQQQATPVQMDFKRLPD